jgi:hypothetical protein
MQKIIVPEKKNLCRLGWARGLVCFFTRKKDRRAGEMGRVSAIEGGQKSE